MSISDIVIDTNVIIAALRSKKGASFKLLSLVGIEKFEIHISVPLVLEYEDVIQRQRAEMGLSQDDVSAFIDSLCALAKHHQIYFLWRPSLTDVNDELLLELAVSAQCEYIVTHNIRDFKGSETFGVKAVTPKEFLKIIDEVKK
jgi:putative PIN family toxin of toxin-antitoxin system